MRRAPIPESTNTERNKKILTAKFASNYLTNRKTMGMFKLNHKAHKMKLRYSKKYKEEKLMTHILYNSSIPYMQRILNKEHKETKKYYNKIQILDNLEKRREKKLFQNIIQPVPVNFSSLYE